MSIRPPCATPLSPPPQQSIWQFAFFFLWTVGSQLSYWELGWCSWSLTRLPCKIELWTCTNLWLPRVEKKHRQRSTSILVELDTLLFDMALKANKFDVSIWRYHSRVQGHTRWFPQRLEVSCTQETGINLEFPLPQTSYAINKKKCQAAKGCWAPVRAARLLWKATFGDGCLGMHQAAYMLLSVLFSPVYTWKQNKQRLVNL